MLSNDQIKFFRVQAELAEKQKELIDLQKKELSENKKDREIINKFTFIIAFGVIVSIIFNIFEIFVEFNETTSLRLLIVSGLFIFLFLFLISFVTHNFPLKEQMIRYLSLKRNIIIFVIILSCIILLMILLFNFPERTIT